MVNAKPISVLEADAVGKRPTDSFRLSLDFIGYFFIFLIFRVGKFWAIFGFLGLLNLISLYLTDIMALIYLPVKTKCIKHNIKLLARGHFLNIF